MAPTDSLPFLPTALIAVLSMGVRENLFNVVQRHPDYLLGCDRSGTQRCYQLDFAAAQWTVIQTNLRLFFVGRFPRSVLASLDFRSNNSGRCRLILGM